MPARSLPAAISARAHRGTHARRWVGARPGAPLASAVVLLAAALLAGARPAAATTILRLDLDALTAAADRVFIGRVVAVRTGRDRTGLPVTWTTFAVDEALKGAPPPTLEIKQLGVDAPLADGTLFRVPALPRYQVGDAVILFLHPESRDGFTSPVGLGQGRFRIRHEHGAAVAENDVGNGNLAPATGPRAAQVAGAPPASAALAPAAPIAVDDLLARIRAAVGTAR